MKRALPIIAGLALAPVCVIGLFWQQSFIWVLCPQALLVMFLRQAQGSPDSLAAAALPDVIVGVLYYPVVGWLLSRGLRSGALRRTAVQVGVWHAAALIAAVAAGQFRNTLWHI